MQRRMAAMACLIMLLLLAAPAAVMGHTGIQVSSPSDAEVVEDELTLVEMTFTTTYEKALSKAALLNEAGEGIPYAELIQGDRSMSMRFEEPLPGGTYKVNWHLVGADGHAVEGQYGFTVMQAEAVEPNPERPAEQEPTAVEPPPEAAADGDESAAEQPEPEAPEPAPDDAEDAETAEEPAQAAAPAAAPSMLGSGGMIAVIAGIAILAFFIIRSLRKQ